MNTKESKLKHMSAQARASALWFAEKEKTLLTRPKSVEERILDAEDIIRSLVQGSDMLCKICEDLVVRIKKQEDINLFLFEQITKLVRSE